MPFVMDEGPRLLARFAKGCADALKAREVLMEESNVQPVRCPVTVCGDIHGQFVSSKHTSKDMTSTSHSFTTARSV